jgi:hypothetical protein
MLERNEGIADRTKHHIQEIKEFAYMTLVDHPISQPSLDTSPIWTPIIAAPSGVDYV